MGDISAFHDEQSPYIDKSNANLLEDNSVIESYEGSSIKKGDGSPGRFDDLSQNDQIRFKEEDENIDFLKDIKKQRQNNKNKEKAK